MDIAATITIHWFACSPCTGGLMRRRPKRIELIGFLIPSKKAAESKAAAIKAGMKAEAAPASLTVGKAIDLYIASKDSVLSPSTIAGYKRQRQNTLQSLMDVPVASLTQEAVQVAVNAMARDKSPKYVKNAYGLLTAALSVYRPGLVLRTTLPQKEKPDISIPSTEDIQRIAQYEKGKRFELPFLLAAWLGLRASEIRGLTWDCVGDGTIHIKQALVDGPDGPVLKLTKTYSRDRVLPVPPYIMALIEAQPHTDEYIIHYDRHQLYKRIESACNTLGIQRYRFHDPRHYQASVMLSMGVPDKYAMERMGHASTNMPKNVYQHTMSEKSRKVAASIDAFFEKNLTTGE